MKRRKVFRAASWATVIGIAVLVACAAQAQVDAELQRLQQDFEVAEATFNSINQPDSISQFNRIITVLQRRLAAGDDAQTRALLVSSLAYRARAGFNNGDTQAAEADVRALISADPVATLDREVSPRFLELFESIRRDMVGYLEFAASPVDARIRVNGRLLEPGIASHAVVAGVHAVAVERPGYRPVQQEVDVGVADRVMVDDVLVRLSAVVNIATRPAGARVTLDGSDMGVTADVAPPNFVPTGDAALYPSTDFSAPLVIEGLQPGPHVVDVALDGYRARRYTLEVDELADYGATIVLEETAGTVVLEALPPDARVTVDGVAATPVRPGGAGSGSPRLSLSPGTHAIEVTRGTAGVFATTVEIVDQRVDAVEVRLRPGLAFLGVLGGDQRGARDLRKLLSDTLGDIDRWTLLDRSAAMPALERAGLVTGTLRAAAETAAGADWKEVQAELDREAPGAVYMLAVLDDDLLATHADLWIWPAAPGPPQPDRVRVRIDSSADIDALAGGFEASTFLTTIWFGALLVDVGDAVTVTSVSGGSPAEAAGLMVGDRLVSVGGRAVVAAAAARSIIEEAAPGDALAVQLQRGASTEIVEIALESSPNVISPSDPSLVYSVISASLAAEEPGAGEPTPSWVVHLNQAAVLLHAAAWEDAVRTLRGIEDAPAGAGIGQATVDYWLGIALTALGPTYRDSAIEAFQRAASDPRARLFHNDGPWVAPRAQARLAGLGGG